jgi:hypothetical protein
VLVARRVSLVSVGVIGLVVIHLCVVMLLLQVFVPEGGSARVQLLELGHSCADIRPLAAEDSCGMHGAVERTSAAPIIT